MLFETDPILVVVRGQPIWFAGAVSTLIFGYIGTRFKKVREPIFVGFFIFTAGIIGLATTQPNSSTATIVFAGLCGFGFGAPLILIIAGVQLSTPHHLIATATAVATSSRAVGGAVSTAIYAAALNNRLDKNLPGYISKAALAAGLPLSSVPAFVGALVSASSDLQGIPGVTPAVIGAGVVAQKHAFADSIRVVFIIAAPFGALACIGSLFLGDLRKTMNYRVDAPVENLHAKHHHQDAQMA